jgi:hypothetical protein
MPNNTLQVVWSPDDAREVFERAATVAAIRAVTETDAHTAESAMLSDLVDRELG